MFRKRKRRKRARRANPFRAFIFGMMGLGPRGGLGSKKTAHNALRRLR